MDRQQKRVAVLSAVVACLAAPGAFLVRHHPRAAWIWVAVISAVFVYTIIEFAGMKRKGR